MALVMTMNGWYDTDKQAFVDAAETPKTPESAPKAEAVDNSTAAPKKAAKKAKK